MSHFDRATVRGYFVLISLFYIGFTLLMLSSILTHFVFTPIYSVLTKDSLYVYTVTTEAFLTGDDFIDDTKPATADTMKKSYHIGDLTAIYR